MNEDLLARFHGVIPAGGVGTRLWPLSRASAPKFLHDLTGSGSTLIRATYDRLVPLAGQRIMVVTGRAHRRAVLNQLNEIQDENLVLEPEPRDSAAAIGLAAAILYRRNPEIIMGSFAADQVIGPVEVFQEAVREAIHTAATGKIVTIGIHPTHPSTGFGYIQTGLPLDVPGAPSARAVGQFVEKPDADTARQYLASGFLWNAGMFVAPVSLMLKHLEANEPALHAGLMRIAEAWDTDRREEVMAQVWPDLPKTAIDYAVAEPAAAAGDVAVIPGVFNWDDVGDFAAIGRLNKASEETGVIVLGDKARVYSDNASGVVYGDIPRVVALIGIDDVIVVDTADALLVTTKEHAQQVKTTVEMLKRDGETDVL
ncbi:sugar phosphate nucleotidyltransferase [Glutamicibacter sp. MNS18]|uniref:mannose-1-phosphate guanylyltransferase n=1 Tax=Glutamicibacter sp. MNS18 TaxID=2989817 RepID=UPI0022369780|nr:mannose-1-phosphate guanylyltransferase [Glutamicibacter sp. MNS18]MCW4465049.1 sugar phosphate nucleotidyltransferase [Glutamicibacter sp. MNS18]